MAAAGNGVGASYGAKPSPVAHPGRGLPSAQMHGRPAMPGHRDPFGYNNSNSPGPGQNPGGYMHGGGVSTYGHPTRVEYGRTDYYYDASGGATSYGANVPYGLNTIGPGIGVSVGPISPSVGAMGIGVSSMGYGGGNTGYGSSGNSVASASVIEDQLLGTYGGGIHRLQNSSLRQGVGSGYGNVGGGGGGSGSYTHAGASTGYGATTTSGGGSGGFMGGLGGYGTPDYDDLTGYRTQSSAGPAGSFSGPASASATSYGGFGFGNGTDVNDRYSGRMGPFTPTSAGGMNGFGMNGLGAPGTASTGTSGSGTSPNRYDYADDRITSPQFQASDILRQDKSGFAGYLAGGSSSGGASNGTGTGTSTAAAKPNGHPHPHTSGTTRGAGTGLGVKDGVHELTGMFGGLAVGGPGGQKAPISPSSAATSGFASQHSHQHFRGDSGRFN